MFVEASAMVTPGTTGVAAVTVTDPVPEALL
jgi:hypothetical protein